MTGAPSPRGIAFDPPVSTISDADAADPVQAAIRTADTVARHKVTTRTAAAVDLNDRR